MEEYIATQPKTVQGVLERVRCTIGKVVPGAEEVISYKIPTYKLHGGHAEEAVGKRREYLNFNRTEIARSLNLSHHPSSDANRTRTRDVQLRKTLQDRVSRVAE